MAYTKMTVADFKKRLEAGDYKDATGARRGAGKADLTDAEKDSAAVRSTSTLVSKQVQRPPKSPR
jgi:hypothetical protein